MKKIYVTLRDKGTTYHDNATGISIVGHQVRLVERQPSITAAITAGRLIQLEDADGKALMELQEKQYEVIKEAEARTSGQLVATSFTEKEKENLISMRDEYMNGKGKEAASAPVTVPTETAPETPAGSKKGGKATKEGDA